MKENPTKAFLNRYRYLVQRRESLLRQIDIIRARATGSSIPIKADIVKSSSAIYDRMAEDAVAMADSSRLLDELVKDIDIALAQILTAFEQVDDEKLRTVLTLRYVEGLSWDKIQHKISYERAQVMRLHGRALVQVSAWMKNKDDTKRDMNM